MDVLAQFQLGHHGPRRRTAQNSHQHLPCSCLLCPHHCGHLQHVSEERKTGHGDALTVKHPIYNRSMWRLFLITNVLLYLTGAYPERHSGRRCCHGDSSRVHDHPLRCTDRGFLLWHHLNVWLSVCHGEPAAFYLHASALQESVEFTGSDDFLNEI